MTARSFGEIASGFVGYRNPDRTRVPRRNSFDVDDDRAQVFRPIRDGWDFVYALMQTFDELLQAQREERYRGKDRLQDGDRRVLRALLKYLDFKTGRLDPCYQTIATRAGCARDTAIQAVKRLAQWLGLRWVRRTIVSENAGQAGPQREQTSNGYFFDLRATAKRVYETFRKALRRRLRQRHGDAPPELRTDQQVPQRAVDPQISAILASIEEGLPKPEAQVGSSDTIRL